MLVVCWSLFERIRTVPHYMYYIYYVYTHTHTQYISILFMIIIAIRYILFVGTLTFYL